MAIGPVAPDSFLALDNDVLNNWRTGNAAVIEAIGNYISKVKTPPALTSTTVFEMMHGFEKTRFQDGANERFERDLHHAKELIRHSTVLPFNQQAAEIAAYIFPRLSRKERKDHWADTLVAATVVAHEYGIATRNRVDFEMLAKHIPTHYAPLRIEVWK